MTGQIGIGYTIYLDEKMEKLLLDTCGTDHPDSIFLPSTGYYYRFSLI